MASKLRDVSKDWISLAQQAQWSASKLAKEQGVSLRTLERYFLKNMNECPQSWLIKQRQYLAVELLKDENSIKRIAGILGYKHSNHFSRDFSNYWGSPPRKYIENM